MSGRVSRSAKGKRPQYFADPATDKLMAIVLSLAAELSVVRERLDAVERLLDERGVLARAAVDDYQADDAARAERGAMRRNYIARVLRIVTAELQRTDDDGATETFSQTLQELLRDDC